MEPVQPVTKTQPIAQPQPINQPQIPTPKPFPQKLLFFLLISAFLLALLVWLYYSGDLPFIKPKLDLGSYKLQCGQDIPSADCTYSQLKPQDRIYLRLDVSEAFKRFKDRKPDVCYYTNIEPQDNLVPSQTITIKNTQYWGGCIKNAYRFYQNSFEFAFFIDGQLTEDKFIVKAFLAPSSTSRIEDRITQEGIEVFELK